MTTAFRLGLGTGDTAVSGGPSFPVTMPIGNLPGWTQVVTEDFAVDMPVGSFLNTTGNMSTTAPAYPDYGSRLTFWADTWETTKWRGTGKARTFPSKVLWVSGGIMHIDMHTENLTIGGVTQDVALSSTLKFARPDGQYRQLYGKATSRFRCVSTAPDPDPAGFVVLWEAIDSRSGFWKNGELGMPETSAKANAQGWMHFAGTIEPPAQERTPLTAFSLQDWHTHDWEWTPGHFIWRIDGVTAYETTDRVPDQVMEFAFFQPEPDNPLPLDPSYRSDLQVDWCTIYDYTP